MANWRVDTLEQVMALLKGIIDDAETHNVHAVKANISLSIHLLNKIYIRDFVRNDYPKKMCKIISEVMDKLKQSEITASDLIGNSKYDNLYEIEANCAWSLAMLNESWRIIERTDDEKIDVNEIH